MKRLAPLFLLFLTNLVLAPNTARAEDMIVRAGGKTTRVFRVKSATFSNVTFIVREGLKEQTIPRENVRRIRFGDTPPAYTAGMDLLRKGEYEPAIKAFQEARTDPNVRSWWASVWCQLHMATAYLEWANQKNDKGKASEAVRIVSAVTAEYPDNFFKPDFQTMLIQALIASGDPGKARSEAERFEQEVANWSDKTWYIQAKLLGAQAMVAAKLYTEAISKLDTLITFATGNNFRDWAAEAQIQQAKAILAQGNKDRALKAFRDLVAKINNDWSHRAAAAAYIGLGRVLLEHFNEPDKARENLLRARVVYFGTEKKDLEVMAEAAFLLGQTNEALAKKGEAGAKIEAVKYYKEVTTEYRTTTWSKEATARLKSLGG